MGNLCAAKSKECLEHQRLQEQKKAEVDVGSWFVYLLGECGSDDTEPLAVAQSV